LLARSKRFQTLEMGALSLESSEIDYVSKGNRL